MWLYIFKGAQSTSLNEISVQGGGTNSKMKHKCPIPFSKQLTR